MRKRTHQQVEAVFEQAFGFLPEDVNHPLVQGLRAIAHKNGLMRHIHAVHAYGDMTQEEALAEIIIRMDRAACYVNEVIDFFYAEIGELPEDGRRVIKEMLRQGHHVVAIKRYLREANVELGDQDDSDAVLRKAKKTCDQFARRRQTTEYR